MQPISVTQIQDTILDLKCLTPDCHKPQCRDLNTDIQTLINAFCEERFDIDKVSQQCFNETSLEKLLSAIIAQVCITSETPVFDLTEHYIQNVNLCNSDNWDLTKNNCIVLLDYAGNPLTQYTIIDIVQLVIKRIMSLQEIIRAQNALIENLQTQINNQQSQLQNVIDNCCNISVLASIQSINSRLTAGGL